jgi:hypothetical membrane protein
MMPVNEKNSRINVSNPGLAGALLLFGGALFWLVTTISEAYYPYFITKIDTLSKLGSVGSPTQVLWNSMMVVLGVSWLLGAFLYFRGAGKIGWIALNLLPGAGILIVAVFPAGTNQNMHLLGAFLFFIMGGVAAIADFFMIRSAFRFFSLAFGIITLAALFFNVQLSAILGIGGAERVIAYLIILWLISFGGCLMGQRNG